MPAAEHARWNNLSDQFADILNDLFGEAVKKDKSFWPGEYEAGMLLLEKYNRPEALDSLQKVLKINPNAAEALAAKGAASLMAFEVKDAEACAESALKVNANSPEALRLRADVYLAGGDAAAALRELEVARSVNPRDERTLGRIGACLIVRRKQAEYEALAKEVATFDSKPAVFYYEMGDRLDESRRFDEAEKSLHKAAALRPNMPGPSNSSASCTCGWVERKKPEPVARQGLRRRPVQRPRLQHAEGAQAPGELPDDQNRAL